ncbi:MAG: FkbM family methyltransferase [Ginsengibacter sp.]
MKAIKKKLLHLINKKGYLLFEQNFFHKLYRLKGEFNPLEQLFYQRLHPNFFFVQIGANDGISSDPIYHLVTKEGVHGIALEPVSNIFDLLTKNYAAYPNVCPVNKAIHKTEKEMVLYRVNPKKKQYPEWTKGIASFNKNHHQLSEIIGTDIIEEKVQCISYDELIKDYNINHIDLLQIDAEGYDYDIIKMIDFDLMAPSIISFEHGVLAGIMDKEKLFEIQDLLFENGYNIITMQNDAIAYKTK